MNRPARLVPPLVGAVVLALYLSLPSFRCNFDGVACAIAVELGDLRHLVHGNHLVYGLAGLVFHRLLLAAGAPLSALWSLQLMDSLLGALAAALFARHLLRRGRPPAAAAAAALGLAASFRWWLLSLDAQVYLLAAPFLVLALDEMLAEKPRPLALAALHSAAMLAHASHALLAPAAVWSLRRAHGDGEAGRRAVGRYLAFCLLAVVAAYAAALALCVRPASMSEVRLWLLGSAALGPGRSYHWLAPAGPASALGHWARAGLAAVCARPLWGLGLWALAAWGAASRRAERERPVALLWLGAYALLFLNWEPWNPDYRVMDLVPLWSLAAAGAAPALASYAALLLAVNLRWGVLPVSRPENNPPLQKARWLDAALPEDAWVSALSIDEVYIPYFDHRRTLNLRWYEGRAADLRARVADLLARGEPVYVTSDHLAAGWAEAFAPFARQEVARWRGVALYRLSVNGKPNGSR